MADTEERQEIQRYHENAILLMGFLGAVVFAGLVLILQNSDFILKNPNFTGAGWGGTPQIFFQRLIFVLSLTVMLSGIAAVLGLMVLSSSFESIRGLRRAFNTVDLLVIAVSLLFLTSVILILVPIDQYVAGAIAIVSFVVFLALFERIMRARDIA